MATRNLEQLTKALKEARDDKSKTPAEREMIRQQWVAALHERHREQRDESEAEDRHQRYLRRREVEESDMNPEQKRLELRNLRKDDLEIELAILSRDRPNLDVSILKRELSDIYREEERDEQKRLYGKYAPVPYEQLDDYTDAEHLAMEKIRNAMDSVRYFENLIEKARTSHEEEQARSKRMLEKMGRGDQFEPRPYEERLYIQDYRDRMETAKAELAAAIKKYDSLKKPMKPVKVEVKTQPAPVSVEVKRMTVAQLRKIAAAYKRENPNANLPDIWKANKETLVNLIVDRNIAITG